MIANKKRSSLVSFVISWEFYDNLTKKKKKKKKKVFSFLDSLNFNKYKSREYETIMHKGKRKVKSLNKDVNVNTNVEENVEGINVNDNRGEIQENINKRKREYLATINQIREPNSYKEVFKRKDKDKWINAMENELNTMKEKKVFKKIEKVPEEANIIDSRWVFKI